MGESMSSLFRRGMISSKQMGRMAKPAILNKTKAQNSKLADFDGKGGKRDQGGGRDRGGVPVNEIEHPTNQDRGGTFGMGGKRGPPTKGARAGAEKNPAKGNELSAAASQKPKFPAGGSVKKNSKPVGRHGLGGTSVGLRSSGPQYGGPNSRANG